MASLTWNSFFKISPLEGKGIALSDAQVWCRKKINIHSGAFSVFLFTYFFFFLKRNKKKDTSNKIGKVSPYIPGVMARCAARMRPEPRWNNQQSRRKVYSRATTQESRIPSPPPEPIQITNIKHYDNIHLIDPFNFYSS